MIDWNELFIYIILINNIGSYVYTYWNPIVHKTYTHNHVWNACTTYCWPCTCGMTLHTCDMTHSYVWQASCVWVCDMNHVCGCVIWIITYCRPKHENLKPKSCHECVPVYLKMYMRHESFIHMTWLICVCDMTHSHVCRDSIACLNMWRHTWNTTHSRVWWPVHTSDMNQSYVWHVPFVRVTWLIHIYDMTHSICVTWLIHVCDINPCDMTLIVIRDLFPRFLFLWLCEFICNMSQSYVCHDCAPNKTCVWHD